MKRKILSLVLCGCLVAGMFPAVALAEDSQGTSTATPVVTAETTRETPTSGQCGDNLTWNYDEASKTLTISGTGDMWDYGGPDNYAPWPYASVLHIEDGVTSIGANAFFYCNFTEVVLPDSITSIGNAAFIQCEKLNSIVIPDSVTSIGRLAFDSCISLNNIELPSGITSIGESTFGHCSSLSSITIPDSVVSIGEYAFQRCSALEAITIPNSVTSIGLRAFDSCIELKRIEIPNSVTSMGNGVFWDCLRLEQVILPNQITTLSRSTFWNCFELTEVTIPSSVESIEASAFMSCSSLDHITIPSTVHYIGDRAFSQCYSLTDIVIPSSVNSMGYGAFLECSNLKEITLPASVTAIAENTFANCTSLTTVNFTGTQEQWQAIAIDENGNDALTSATIHYSHGAEVPTPEPTPTPAPTQNPEETTPPTTGGETTTPDKVDVTVSGDKAEATVGGVDIVLGNAGKVFEDGTVVTVEKITQGTIYDTVKKALEKVVAKMDNTAIFEFTATKDGKPVQPGGSLSVTFDIPKNLTASNLKMFYVSEDGKYEEVQITVDTKANTVTATLTHFSTYVLANVAPAANDGNGVPQTGDTSALTLYVCVLAMSMAGLTILLVNKRRA